MKVGGYKCKWVAIQLYMQVGSNISEWVIQYASGSQDKINQFFKWVLRYTVDSLGTLTKYM